MGDIITPRKKTAPAKQMISGSAAPASEGLVVADLNAQIRAKAVTLPGPGPQLSMKRVVTNVITDMTRALTHPTHLVAVYDTIDGLDGSSGPRSMPKMRDVLWSERYARPLAPIAPAVQKKVLEYLEAAAASNVAAALPPPASYSVLFTPGPLKMATWKAFMAITRRVGATLHAQDKIPHFSLVAADHATFSTERGNERHEAAFAQLARENLGEADLKIYRCAQLLNPKGALVLKTVDTDVILQTLATPEPPARATTFKLALKDFDVDATRLLQRFGPLPTVRLETVFWWIAAGGTDYCKPISDQGYGKKQLLDLTHPKHAMKALPLFTEDAASPFRFRFHPANALKKLQGLPKTRKVARDHAGKAKKSGRSLSGAVRQVMLSTAYYSLLHTHPDPATFMNTLIMSPKALPLSF